MARAKGIFNFFTMVLAFLAIGGFLYWLGITAVPTEVAVAVEEETAQAVSITAFAQNPLQYEGILIAVDDVQVQSLAGGRVFFAALPDDSSYPIRLDASVGMGVQLAPDDQGRVTGTVHVMTDSVLDAWAAESQLTDDVRQAASASGSFLLAHEVELVVDMESGDADGA